MVKAYLVKIELIPAGAALTGIKIAKSVIAGIEFHLSLKIIIHYQMPT
jgi:hypothetical protein